MVSFHFFHAREYLREKGSFSKTILACLLGALVGSIHEQNGKKISLHCHCHFNKENISKQADNKTTNPLNFESKNAAKLLKNYPGIVKISQNSLSKVFEKSICVFFCLTVQAKMTKKIVRVRVKWNLMGGYTYCIYIYIFGNGGDPLVGNADILSNVGN